MTDQTHLERELEFARRLADAARQITLARFRGRFEQRIKHDGSIVTEVDEAVEDTLRALVARDRADDAVLGEERGQSGGGARRWVIDAIDGTASFAAGRPEWGTLIALEVDGEVVVGICDEPALDRRYWATRGGGAWCTVGREAERRLSVTGTGELSRSRSFVPPPHWVPDQRARKLADALAAATTPGPADAHPALAVASGDYELAVFFVAGPWDLAAPALVVEEAGGRFTDLGGHKLITSGTAVFSNGLVHEAALQITR
jgi:histidinol-phosphatase